MDAIPLINQRASNEEIFTLLDELVENRKKLYSMITTIEGFRKNLKDIMPKTVNFQNRFVMENKMKIFTEVIDAELNIRKQIDNSIKLETDIRRKIGEKEMTEEEKSRYVRDIVKVIETQKDAEQQGNNIKELSSGSK